MVKKAEKWSKSGQKVVFLDPFLSTVATVAKGVFRGSMLPLIRGCNGLFWPVSQKGEKGVKKGSKRVFLDLKKHCFLGEKG
jgi:hypothetical protein